MVEVARVLGDESTFSEAELTAATEVASAVCCLASSGTVEFDLDERLVYDRQRRQNKFNRLRSIMERV